MSTAEAPAVPTSPQKPAASNVAEYLGRTPAALARIVGCVKPERFDERTDPHRFTLREAVAHLADYEETVLDRFTIAAKRPGEAVENFDEAARVEEKGYAKRDVHRELEVFQNRRRDTISFLQGLSDDDLGKTFVHPQRGALSVSDYLSAMLGHDLYHLEHATEYLK